jgi:hypothetical protein
VEALKMKGLRLALFAATLVTFGSTLSHAQDSVIQSPEAAGTVREAMAPTKGDNRLPIHKQDQWQFFLSPYMWIAGANLQTTLKGHTSSVDVPWWDVAADLFSNVIGVMGRFEAWKGRWGLYLDSYFVYLGGTTSDSAGKRVNLGLLPVNRTLVLDGTVKYITRAGNLDFGGRYLVGTTSLSADAALPVLSFELLGGGRYNYYNQYLRLGVGTSFTGPVLDRFRSKDLTSEIKRSYVEPFLGLRLGLWLNDKALCTFRGTVGGFGLFNDHNLDSDLELSFGYRVHKNIYAYLGYRARYDQFHTSELDFSAWLHGPILGAVFAF